MRDSSLDLRRRQFHRTIQKKRGGANSYPSLSKGSHQKLISLNLPQPPWALNNRHPGPGGRLAASRVESLSLFCHCEKGGTGHPPGPHTRPSRA